LAAAVTAHGSHLMDPPGIGRAGAARILADVGDITRFPTKAHFASWTGTAPTDASSSEHSRHRYRQSPKSSGVPMSTPAGVIFPRGHRDPPRDHGTGGMTMYLPPSRSLW
jgi:hypothetical protein